MTKIVLSSALAALTFSAVSAVVANDKVRRPARLFVAGDFPEKGVTITEADLDTIVANFNTGPRTAPVKSEHADGPLDPLGEVVALHREGPELYGVLVFSAGIDAHIRERGAEHISVGLARDAEKGLTLTEASLVLQPRVANAGFLAPAKVDELVAQFTAAGKITPAMEPAARRLLSVPQSLTFSNGAKADLGADVLELLGALPVVQPRGGSVVSGTHNFARVDGPSAATKEFAGKLGVDPEKMHRHLTGAGKAA